MDQDLTKMYELRKNVSVILGGGGKPCLGLCLKYPPLKYFCGTGRLNEREITCLEAKFDRG